MKRLLFFVLAVSAFLTGFVGLGWWAFFGGETTLTVFNTRLTISESYWINLSTDCVGLLIGVWIVDRMLARARRNAASPFFQYQGALIEKVGHEYERLISQPSSIGPASIEPLEAYVRVLGESETRLGFLVGYSESEAFMDAISDYAQALQDHSPDARRLRRELVAASGPDILEAAWSRARASGAAMIDEAHRLLDSLPVAGDRDR